MTCKYSRVIFIPGWYDCWPSGISLCVCLLQDNFRTLDYLMNSNISENVLGNGQCHINFGENKKMKGERYIYRACDLLQLVSRCSCFSHPGLWVMTYRSKGQVDGYHLLCQH